MRHMLNFCLFLQLLKAQASEQKNANDQQRCYAHDNCLFIEWKSHIPTRMQRWSLTKMYDDD